MHKAMHTINKKCTLPGFASGLNEKRRGLDGRDRRKKGGTKDMHLPAAHGWFNLSPLMLERGGVDGTSD